MDAPTTLHSRLILATLLLAVALLPRQVDAQAMPCGAQSPCPVYVQHATVIAPEPASPSWIFRRGTYTHDPYTGARVAQFEPIPPVEPLDDQRMVTSRYRRSRTNLRGADGSVDTYYEVQQWGNGRGGLDAEWERFHDAWKESYLTGGYYNQSPYVTGSPYGGQGYGYGGGFGWPGQGFPGNGLPGGGFPGGGYPGGGYQGGGYPGYSFPPPGYGGGWGGGPPQGHHHGDGPPHDHHGDGPPNHND